MKISICVSPLLPLWLVIVVDLRAGRDMTTASRQKHEEKNRRLYSLRYTLCAWLCRQRAAAEKSPAQG